MTGRVVTAMDHVAAVLSAPASEAPPKVADFHSAHREVEEALRAVVEELREGNEDPKLWSTLIELHQVQRELVEQRLVQRLEALERVREALARLRELGPVGEILRHSAAELSASTGLDRVLVSQVMDARLLPLEAHCRDDPEGADAAVEALRAEPLALEYPVVEAELLRRRRATIVQSGGNRRSRPPLPVGEGLSYVAAPIVLDGAAVGFFHGAHADRQVESLERDAVWAFADGFAQVFERAVLRRRVREQRRQLRELVAWTDAMAADLSEGAIALEVESEPAATKPDVDGSRLAELLTRRELDVLRLMARGDSNKAIATELVVSEGTVKFHVKNILRKLRAGNRVEAASRYHQLVER
jgi:DNA-binding CsgD family transcriptional regulator